MKNLLRLLIIIIILSASAFSAGEVKICQGIAERSKAGLVVSGFMIISLSEKEMGRYEGKYVKVKGFVQYKHKYMVDENDPVKKQGFNMPVMYKVISIEIVDKN